LKRSGFILAIQWLAGGSMLKLAQPEAFLADLLNGQ